MKIRAVKIHEDFSVHAVKNSEWKTALILKLFSYQKLIALKNEVKRDKKKLKGNSISLYILATLLHSVCAKYVPLVSKCE